MTEEMLSTDPQERFQDILKAAKYRERLSRMAITGSTALTVDFEELLALDSALAENIFPERC